MLKMTFISHLAHMLLYQINLSGVTKFYTVIAKTKRKGVHFQDSAVQKYVRHYLLQWQNAVNL